MPVRVTHPLHVSRRLDLLVGLEVDTARAKVDRRNDLDAKLVLGHLDELFADVVLECLLHMIGVTEQERRRQQRPGRNLLGDVCRREIAQVEVVALKRYQLGALLEERVAPIRLEFEIVLDRSGERLVGIGAQIGLGEGSAEAELLPGLSAGAPGGGERKNGGATGDHGTARKAGHEGLGHDHKQPRIRNHNKRR